MTLEDFARNEGLWFMPSELDLYCPCVNALTGHQRLHYNDSKSAMYRCYACGKTRVHTIEQDLYGVEEDNSHHGKTSLTSSNASFQTNHDDTRKGGGRR